MDNHTYVRLSQNAKKSWFVSRFIFLIVLIVITMIPFIIFNYNKWVIIIGGILILLQTLNTFLYPIIEFKQWKYMINEEMIEYVEGIFFIKTTIIPIVRIQNLTISEGPINRFLHLAKIEIFTAGSTLGSTFSIPNLDKDVADEICMSLRNTINERVQQQKESKDDRKES